MGFFIYTVAEVNQDKRQPIIQFAESNGFSLKKSLRTEFGLLELFANLSGSDPQILNCPGGDFIFSFGFFMYHQQIGETALKQFYSDFDPVSFAWSELVGQHTILIRKNGRLQIFADGLGACRIFKNADSSVISNAFLPVLQSLVQPKFDLQGCFEYVFAGSCYGGKTFVENLSSFPPNSIISFSDGMVETKIKQSPITQKSWPRGASLSALAKHHTNQIDEILEPVGRHYSDRLRLSFSGGFDSRLILASLMKYGIKPSLFSYGSASDLDVRIAKEVATDHALKFEHIDKSKYPTPDIEAFPELVEKDLFTFDGWKTSAGIFSSGADFEDRLRRHKDGQLPINGSLGEIYRNFFYLPAGEYRPEDIVSAFFSRYDPKTGGRLFDDKSYRANLALEIRRSIGSEFGRLSRDQVEEVYPLFRGRYWTGHDARVNQRFGHMLFPYLEHKLISGTASIPLHFKDLGILQGEMIRMQFAPLARSASSYGFALGERRPFKALLSKPLSYRRPLFLRRRSFRLQHRHAEALPQLLSDEYLRTVIDLDFPYMQNLFNFQRLFVASQYSSVATLEYIGQKFGFADL